MHSCRVSVVNTQIISKQFLANGLILITNGNISSNWYATTVTNGNAITNAYRDVTINADGYAATITNGNVTINRNGNVVNALIWNESIIWNQSK